MSILLCAWNNLLKVIFIKCKSGRHFYYKSYVHTYVNASQYSAMLFSASFGITACLKIIKLNKTVGKHEGVWCMSTDTYIMHSIYST